MKFSSGLLYAFLGGAIVGCGAAILLTPVKGSDLRAKITSIIRKKGIKISESEIDELVSELSGINEK